jgi:hypothetical protein
MTRRLVLALLPAVLLSTGCLAQSPKERPVGMTLLFLNLGSHPIGVARFDPDGQRGPVPGGLSVDRDEKRGGKQMTFMPGDSQRPVAQWVEVEWTIEPKSQESAVLYGRADKYSVQWMKDHAEFQSRLQRVKRKIELAPILTSEIIERARQSPKTTNVKLKVIFRDDQVSITADNEVWR